MSKYDVDRSNTLDLAEFSAVVRNFNFSKEPIELGDNIYEGTWVGRERESDNSS